MNKKLEIQRLYNARETAPPDIGHSMIAYVTTTGRTEEVVGKIRSAWSLIIEWGTLYESSFDFNVSNEQRFKAMPSWFQRNYHSECDLAWQSLCEGARERDWFVWGLFWEGHVLKLDINQYSYPNSIGALRQVIEAAGGNFIVAVDYLPMEILMDLRLSEL